MEKEFLKLDLYSLLGVDELSSEKEIVKGYRKRALKCHPDKNPDNPKAGEEFHRLSKALEVLTDASARAAYDQTRKAKKAAEERTRVLDSKRKKFKDDLEAREKAFFEHTEKAKEVQAEKKLQAEIERLRKEGSRLLEQEQERLREELRKPPQASHESPPPGAREPPSPPTGQTPRMKLKWKAPKSDNTNGGYSNEKLSSILSCYGTVSALIVSSKRNGSAIVEFDQSGVSSDILDETGLSENPLTMTWLSGKPSKDEHESSAERQPVFNDCVGNPLGDFTSPNTKPSVSFEISSGVSFGVQGSSGSPQLFGCGAGATPVDSSSKDFESIVLRNMRLAEERKKLIQQMAQEDGE